MTSSGIFHRLLFSIVLAAPFYNLMKRSEYKFQIIAGVLIVLNLLLYFITSKAKKTLFLRPVSIKDRREFLKSIKSYRKGKIHSGRGETSETRLRDLKRLLDSGLISEEEYKIKKGEILDEL